MHTYIHTVILIISLHTYIIFRLWDNLGSVFSPEPVSTRFWPPVSADPSVHMCKKRRFGLPVCTSLLVFPRPPHSDTVVKGAELFDALAAESIKNGPFSGAAAEKEVRSEARGAPVSGGSGASKTFCFQVFLKKKTSNTPDPQAGKCPNRMSAQKCPSGLWL